MKFQITIIIIGFILCDIITKSTSMHDGVSWNNQQNQWQVNFDIHGKKQKSYFDNEINGAKKLNTLGDKTETPAQNPESLEMQNKQKTKETSQYKGVQWNKLNGKWKVLVSVNGEKQKYGGMYKNELDAAKRVNQICEELNIPLVHPTISAIPNEQYQKMEKISQYKGVSYNNKLGKWYARLHLTRKIVQYGGTFNTELDAARRVNELCQEMQIPQQNLTLGVTPNRQYEVKRKQKISKNKGVYWHRKKGKWFVSIRPTGQKQVKYGGWFKDENDARKRVNQLYKELEIPLPNPEISAMPNHHSQKQEKLSQYIGVYWNKKNKKWFAMIQLQVGTRKYGGAFSDELEAAKSVNQMCEENGIPIKNLGIKRNLVKSIFKKILLNSNNKKSEFEGLIKIFDENIDPVIPTIKENLTTAINNEEHEKQLFDHDAMQAEFEALVKVFNENNNPDTNTIKENLIAAINHKEPKIMTEINFCTKNGESALSIAAKYGFSNVVKFLISKGANKQHFTNEHHTPLSLAVSHNHLNVVQILFEDWISPNFHEKPYLHLSPIFNVKSTEIAQLLIDNDAVTHDIYNDKHQSPLTVACQNGYLDVVEFFLNDGLDINHLDNDNKTPLFYALANKHHEIANLLISKGAQN